MYYLSFLLIGFDDLFKMKRLVYLLVLFGEFLDEGDKYLVGGDTEGGQIYLL
jgi:hypothetical protein